MDVSKYFDRKEGIQFKIKFRSTDLNQYLEKLQLTLKRSLPSAECPSIECIKTSVHSTGPVVEFQWFHSATKSFQQMGAGDRG